REVSRSTGAAVVTALAEAGYRVSPIEADRDLAARLAALCPEVVFNALHGRSGEDGCVQGILQVLGIPYTHSGVLASALAMDKPTAKILFAAAGLRCPSGRLVPPATLAAGHPMPVPYVIKPPNEGSTVGVRIVRSATERPFGNAPWEFPGDALVEEYIPGRELSVAVMGARALGVVEIISKTAFYDYEAKYSPGMSDHLVPAPLPDDITTLALETALKAHQVLGCRGVSRADLRWDDTRGAAGLYLLEVNTQPGLTPTSLVPDIARHVGISFSELVSWMVENAALDT
ncbi:MAG: D-alanine--D-alanine ligase, partial [Alphaproteobacteria bacterium]|nr:D-alanine--D-alanine ligase [Alphaproteobacteria bacterium]